MAEAVDVLVVGGGLGGVAAASAAASYGVTTLLIEASGWLGGQLTAQGICTPDEVGLENQPVVETCGATAGYQDLKHRIREHYRTNVGLSAAGRAKNPLNPGGCWVNYGFATEPLVATKIIDDVLGAQSTLTVWKGALATDVQRDANGAIASVTIAKADGTTVEIAPRFVLDATETGDFAAAAGLRMHVGAEARGETGESGAADEAHPDWIQPITYPIALVYRSDGGDYTIPKPDGYDAVKAQQSFTLVDGAITRMFGPEQFWTYRRVIDRSLFDDPNYRYDVATINTGSNDYRGAAYPSGDAAQDQQTLHDARLASRCYLYWLQTEAPRDKTLRDGGGHGYPELMPATEFWGTGDYLAPQPYIREARRIDARTIVVQGDIDDTNPGVRARNFADSCGVGNYHMDVHAGPNGMPESHFGTKPYEIPTGALVPKDCPNLLAAGKCLGVTHLTNGAYRLHPQEWNVGESAGTLAAFCLQAGVLPGEVLDSPNDLLVRYQATLLARGVPLFWWLDVTASRPQFAAIGMAGVRGAFEGDPGSLAFRPDDAFPASERAAMEAKLGQSFDWPTGNLTRAEAAAVVAKGMGWL